MNLYQNPSARIIADHLRAVVFIIGDQRGVRPSNVDQGYIARRLIRRAIRHGRKLGIIQNFTCEIAEVIIKNYCDIYPELEKNSERILNALREEEEKFSNALTNGERELEKAFARQEKIDGTKAFYFYESFGFPLEMTEEILNERGLKLTDEERKDFDNAFEKHQILSRAGSEQKFKGGLADNSEQTTKLHTATHLLHASLRRVLGNHAEQRGSNITPERLRFDFSCLDKMTPEQIQVVEDLVNEQIAKKLPVDCIEMTVEEAKEKGAMGLFGHKYGDKVKVYTIGTETDLFSREICGGPHVKNLSELGKFKIQKEESSSKGVRRIKAVVE